MNQVDAVVGKLANHKDTWAQVSIPERIAYLHRCIDGVMAVAALWAEAACRAKGIDPESTLAGEEWFVGPVAILFYLQLLIKALAAEGQPQPVRVETRPDGQIVAQVFPDNWLDRFLWLGFKGEVWIEPGKPATQGAIYRQPTPGQVALVLGAGNISSIGPLDALYKLFVENQVVLLKMNPVNEYVGSFIEKAFASLKEDGFFEVVYGGAELGRYLCQHSEISTIHITGSHRTHDAIVWGNTPEEQEWRQATHQPVLTKPMTSELGCVTPVLVVPGNWPQSDLAYQAHHVASMVAHNASFNCAAAKVIVTAQGWQQRAEFLQQLHQELANIPPRQAYYPGAQQRYQSFLEHYPQAQALAIRTAQIVPWTVIPDVPPQAGEYGLTEEAFCGVLAEVTLDVQNAQEFLTQAVNFANEKVWGTLSCVVLIDPVTQAKYAPELDWAIANLRYGAIGLNIWSGIVYGLSAVPWGAFPGNSLNNIGSGRGVVHNAFLFDYPQKSVLWAPFRIRPTPSWFARHKNLLQLAQRYTALQANPNWRRFLDVALAALQG